MIKAIGWLFSVLLMVLIIFVTRDITSLMPDIGLRLMLLSWLCCAFGGVFIPLFAEWFERVTAKKKTNSEGYSL
ncbi:hypothetical protein [Brevibacillus reuszeri]|uniref:hypothetical protein n=1 Tax=Brevibacillus reuszeri TaxID=54915 RepID=UPI000CCC1CBB|nr:hypothetical protein [Brevibacillus reuszeri]